MATTSEHIAARDDLDLQKRLIAAAEQAGIPNAQSAVVSNLGALVCASITVAGQPTTLAGTHAYAAAVRQQALDALPPAPGLDPAAVTDVHLAEAITTVLGVTP